MPMFAKRHYEWLAALILRNGGQLDVETLIRALRQENPAFKVARFRAKSGTPEPLPLLPPNQF